MSISLDIEMKSVDASESVLNKLQSAGGDSDESIVRSSRDRHSSIRSLTVMSPNSVTRTFISYSKTNKAFFKFLIFTGNYWPKPQTEQPYFFAQVNFITVRFAVCFCAAFSGMGLEFYAGGPHLDIIMAVIFGMLFLGSLAVLPAQYFNSLRLFMPAEVEDFLVIDECVHIAVFYGVISILCVFFGLVFGFLFAYIVAQNLFFEVSIFSIFVALSLVFNIFFLLLDLKVSLLLLDQLHILADKKMLNFDKFCQVRSEIHRRVNASRLACDFVIIPAIAASIGIFASILMIDKSMNSNSMGTGAALPFVGIAMVQLKELFFVAIAFWYVAKVNGRADELAIKLSEGGFWGTYLNSNNSISGTSTGVACAGTESVDTAESVQLSDLHRVSIFMSSVSKPISFTLVFQRVSWRTVLAGAVGITISVFVSILKSVAASRG
jgi:hypothetical protein